MNTPLDYYNKAKQEEDRLRAKEICFQGLTKFPSDAKLRFLLAKLFYLDGYLAFTIEQLQKLKETTDVPSLSKLIALFSNTSGETEMSIKYNTEKGDQKRTKTDDTVAELDLEIDFVDILEELEEKEDK